MNEPPKRYPHLSVEEEAKLRGIDPRWIEIERRQNDALSDPEFLEALQEEAETEDETTARLAKIQGEQEILERIEQTADPELKAKLFKLWQKGKL